MALILGKIPQQAFEVIRDAICQILITEFAYQYAVTYGTEQELNLKKVYMERMTPFDYTELSALNVGIERGDYQNQHQGHADGTFRFFIECNTVGKTDVANDERGDTVSKVLVHRIMGVARAILENPIYKTLGFAPGALVMHRHIESFVFAEPTRQDQEDATMARMILVVRAAEVTALKDVEFTIAGNDSHVTLHDSDKGYFWSIDF